MLRQQQMCLLLCFKQAAVCAGERVGIQASGFQPLVNLLCAAVFAPQDLKLLVREFVFVFLLFHKSIYDEPNKTHAKQAAPLAGCGTLTLARHFWLLCRRC